MNDGQAGNHAGPYTQISAGDFHTCALTPAGATDCWGFNDDGQVLYLTTRAAFNVDAAHGSHSMVYRYDRGSGQFSGPFFSAPANGLNRPVDGLQVDGQLP